jgi:large subunit ribosomal protein L28
MAQVCAVCGKRVSSGFNVSNSQRHTKRKFRPNLQRVRVQVNGARRRMRVCTSCLKAGKVKKAG